MNFQTILEELNKLYEEEKVEAEANELMEDADEEILIDDEPITDDEVEESSEEPDEEAVDTPKQLILECSNCGGLVIKAEADVTVDDETDLANVDEKCQYCEEAKGYKITGEVIPYEGVVEDTDEADDADEVDDDLEEGIFDKFKKKKEEPKDSNEGKDPYLGKNMWCAIEKDHGFWKPAMLPFDEGSKDEDIARRKEQDDPNNYHVVRYDDVAELFNRKKDKNNDDSNKGESEGITTYTTDEWERAEDIAYNIYTKSGKGGSGKVWDEVVEFSACPNLATDIIDYMNAYFGYGKYEKGYDKTKRLNPMDFAKHLEEDFSEENLEEGIFDGKTKRYQQAYDATFGATDYVAFGTLAGDIVSGAVESQKTFKDLDRYKSNDQIRKGTDAGLRYIDLFLSNPSLPAFRKLLSRISTEISSNGPGNVVKKIQNIRSLLVKFLNTEKIGDKGGEWLVKQLVPEIKEAAERTFKVSR